MVVKHFFKMKITHFTHPSSRFFFHRLAASYVTCRRTFDSRLLVDMGSFPRDLQREIRLREKVHFGWVSRMVRGFWAIWRRTVFGVHMHV